MTASLFLGYVILTSGVAVAVVGIYVSSRIAGRLFIGIAAWLTYVGALGYFGVIRDAALRPPGIVLVVGPVVLFMIFVVARSASGARVAAAIPLPLLIAAQSFRVGVELFLHQIWLAGLVPKMLTFQGANFDILIGLSAPFLAWAAACFSGANRLVLAWNVIGLVSLANVAARAALTAPGPLGLLHMGIPNLAIGIFPFTYIAGFFAPLAVALHILALKAIRQRRIPNHASPAIISAIT